MKVIIVGSLRNAQKIKFLLTQSAVYTDLIWSKNAKENARDNGCPCPGFLWDAFQMEPDHRSIWKLDQGALTRGEG
jgi:hypothetical protein